MSAWKFCKACPIVGAKAWLIKTDFSEFQTCLPLRIGKWSFDSAKAQTKSVECKHCYLDQLLANCCVSSSTCTVCKCGVYVTDTSRWRQLNAP